MLERDEIRRIVAEVLELPKEELDDRANFTELYFADSLERYRIVLGLESYFSFGFRPKRSIKYSPSSLRSAPFAHSARDGERRGFGFRYHQRIGGAS